RLVGTDQSGSSDPGFSARPATGSVAGAAVSEATHDGTTAWATYEVLNADPASIEMAVIPVAVAFSAGVPTPGAVIGSFDFAPVYYVGTTADTSAPIPRFNDQSTLQWNAYSINACGVLGVVDSAGNASGGSGVLKGATLYASGWAADTSTGAPVQSVTVYV